MEKQTIRILLIEDDDVDREAIERRIFDEHMLYDIQSTRSIAGALDRLQETSYDLVILDLDLDDGTGFEVLPYVGDTPAIFVTGSGDEEIAVKAMRQGAYDYLIKDPDRDYLKRLTGTIQNVLYRRKTERALLESEERYRNVYNTAPLAFVVWDRETRITDWNKKAQEVFGWSKEEIQGKSFFNFLIPENDRYQVEAVVESLLNNKLQNHTINDNLTKNGRIITCEWNNSILHDGDGNIVGAISLALNITERKQAEKALRESEAKFRKLFEQSNDPIFIQDFDGRILDVNIRGCEMLNYSYDQILSIPVQTLHAEEAASSAKEAYKTMKENGSVRFESLFKKANDSKINVEVSSKVIDSENGIVQSIVRDITERKMLEKQILQTQKMKAISSLAGGIAHKYNNSLSGIMGNIELLKMANPDSKNLDKYTDRMLDSVRNMANLSNQLLAYAEGGKYQPKPLSLRDVIDSTLSIVNRKTVSAIRVETDIPGNSFNIKGDQTQIQMLLSAIIENAGEAIENEGRIRIILRNEEVDGELAKRHLGLKTGSYVCIRVIDDGRGMDEETKHRIFEPFFTTNFQGRGLGMAAAYGIIKNHNGWIDIDSKPDKGTMVSIYLPAADIPIKKPVKPKVDISLGAGTILLIEDEEMVLDVERAMIEKLGYTVLVARCGKEAIDIAGTFYGNIDLALLDMGLPDIGGKELYPLLKEVLPNLKVVVVSGYSIDGPARDVLDAGAQAFIQKPFAFAELSATLKQMIDRRKQERFRVKKGAFAGFQSDLSKQGQIIDISRSGLAFYYKENGKLSKELAESPLKISLKNFNLDNIPCRIISDSSLADDSPLEPGLTRRCGIQFGDLTPNQIDQLEHFIRNNTISMQ